MKKILLSIIFLLLINTVNSQDFISPLNHTDDLKYKAGELLVKFKSDVRLAPDQKGQFERSGIQAIDKLADHFQVTTFHKVFKGAERNQKRHDITFPDGTKKQTPELFNIYLIKYDEKYPVAEIIEAFNQLEEVEYAEGNGEAYINEVFPISDPIDEAALTTYNSDKNHSSEIIIPDDPYYNEQWYLPHIKADSLWMTTTGDTNQIIAILDTGVDYLHPDLVNKIWINHNEIPNNGIDDDNNGFIDDYMGWDFVNEDNDPRDDNSHGTHCAGIAGAETNNGIGIAGTSWGVKIMPVKVFQSNGIGYFSHIAQGFWYAAQNGATIYSNSWSSGGESLAIRDAMEYAYAYGIIVAAAGNMNYKTDLPFPPWPPYQPNYPACYNWVLGVEATLPDKQNAWFSNFDPTGPIISDSRPYGGMYWNDYDYNYELRVPGVGFMSTVPNGQYRAYSGTSMACPLAAGAIALMKSYKPELSNEQVFAKLIQPVKLDLFQAGVMDIQKSTFIDPPADLYYVSHKIIDSLYDGDRDGRPDAGETIDIYIRLKNAGGLSDSVFASLRFTEFEDTTTAQILKNRCYLGSISAYATNTSFDPIRVKIDSNVVNARIISFELLFWEKGSADTLYKNITITIEHGVEIKGTYETLHLSGDAYYLVTEVAVIDSLIIDPGVTVRFSNGNFIMITQYLSAIGNADSLITFKGAEGSFLKSIIMAKNAYSEFEYCKFTEAWSKCNDMMLVNPTKIKNSIFTLSEHARLFTVKPGGEYSYNVIHNNGAPHCGYMIEMWDLGVFEYNVISGNTTNGISPFAFVGHHLPYPQCMNYVKNNLFFNNDMDMAVSGHNGWPMGIYKISENYWGTTDITKIKSNILDFYEDQSRPVLEPETILETPPAEAHGIVWKVQLNGQNPQEEIMEPIGPGSLKFDVYFNRPMDTTFTPFLTFGVRYPFTQNIVMDSASWNADSTIWTAYHQVDISTGDGENTIRVAHAKDTDHFDIPIERSRFSFVIQAASSQSVNFSATPGIGKVALEWSLSDSSNVLGYNLYRFRMLNDNNTSDTLALNEGPIVDSTFVDYNVIPDSTYFYLFTAMRTDFTESDFSKVATATPFSAANGDANGDLTVNVLDITTIVSYILNQNPQPFLSDAADVNYDGQINLLDIIGVVNLIMNDRAVSDRPFPMISQEKAYYEWRGHELWLHSTCNLAGLQFSIELPKDMNPELLSLKSKLKGFEMAWNHSNNQLDVVLFSLDGKTIPAEEQLTLELSSNESMATFNFNSIFGGDLVGDIVEVLPFGMINLSEQTPDQVKLQVQPNPFSHQQMISWDIPEAQKVTLQIFDNQGRLVKSLYEGNLNSSSLYWEANDDSKNIVSKGIYILKMKYAVKNEQRQIERKIIFQ
ncbi:MAG: S8 family serine peptidase [Bacteroidales bacterium]|nr:S8 family serine peptidase [Bacteroidales bacterium]